MPGFARSEVRRLLRFYNSVSNVSRCRIADAAMKLLATWDFPDHETAARFARFSSPDGNLSIRNFPECVQAATKMYKDDRDIFENVFGTEEAFVEENLSLYPAYAPEQTTTTTTPRNTPNPATPTPIFFTGTAHRLPELDLNAMD